MLSALQYVPCALRCVLRVLRCVHCVACPASRGGPAVELVFS